MTDTDRYLTLHLPAELTDYVNDWIHDWRPRLIKNPAIDNLWIGIRGAPMYERGIYERIVRMTKDVFGTPINPHLFRDIAVTTVADQTPENIGITAPLLGHINPKSTEDHYIHANQLSAGRRYRHSVEELRKRGNALFNNKRHKVRHKEGED